MSIVTRQRDAVRSRLLDTIGAREEWMAEAACSPDRAEEWWAISAEGQHAAAAYCRLECPVIAECGARADRLGIRDGVWAGETEHQRRIRLAKKRPAGKKLRVCAECGNPYDGPGYKFCSDACYLLSRLAESTKQRMREESPA